MDYMKHALIKIRVELIKGKTGLIRAETVGVCPY